MAKILWQVPLIQYGKFFVEYDENELGVDASSPYELGHAYAVWCNLAMQGFEAGKKIDVSPPDVTGQYQESSEPTPEQAEENIKALGATTVEPWTQTPETKPKAWDNFDI